MKRFMKRILAGFLILLLFLSILPYLIPLSSAEPDDPAPFPESQFLTIDGAKIHYRQWRPKTQRIKGKILLVHGLAGSTFSWRNNIDPLTEQGYLVAAADLPGFGYSERESGLDHSQKNRSRQMWSLLDQIDASLDQTGSDLRWILVGHSMGGGAVSAMTIDQPERTKGLVLVDGALFDQRSGFLARLVPYPPFDRWIKVWFHFTINNHERFRNLLASAYGRQPLDSEVQGYWAPLKLEATADTLIDLVRTAKNEPIEALSGLDVPMLAIWGEEDVWIPLENMNRIKAVLPQTTTSTIEGAAHCPMETHPEPFNSELLLFLKSLDQGYPMNE